MTREQEESQAHHAVELHQRTHNDKERRLGIALLLDKEETEQQNGRNGNVELLHIECREQLVGTEPPDEHLLAVGELRVAHGQPKGQCQQHQPQQ